MKKKIFSFLLVFLTLALTLVSAEVRIEKQAIADSVIPEIKNAAVFKLSLTNLNNGGNFRIYSLVGVEIYPNESFFVDKEETKEVEISLYPGKKILETPGTFNFVYKIESSLGIQEEVIQIRIVNLKDAVEINSYNINLDAEKATVYVKNMVGIQFSEIKARFHSAFFDFNKNFSLDKYETKKFDIPLNEEEIKTLTAGQYTLTADTEIFNTTQRFENIFRFLEKPEISTKNTTSGLIISTSIIEKTNEGNLPSLVQVKLNKNILSRLFTTFNIEPSSVERKGFLVSYIFQKEIKPAEVFTVKATTNWLYPLIILLALIIIGFLVNAYTSTDLILRKRANFVRTKGGEFALKIILIVKTKKFVEKINIIDKIPAFVKIYERFGAINPDKIDEKNKRLEWNIDSLQVGEERVLSYIIYSKIGFVGKFELPKALAVYEREGKTYEAESNKVYFLSEARKKEE